MFDAKSIKSDIQAIEDKFYQCQQGNSWFYKTEQASVLRDKVRFLDALLRTLE